MVVRVMLGGVSETYTVCICVDAAVMAHCLSDWVQIGWVFKGVVYAIIGGVACQAAAQGVSKVNGADISPQVSSG